MEMDKENLKHVAELLDSVQRSGGKSLGSERLEGSVAQLVELLVGLEEKAEKKRASHRLLEWISRVAGASSEVEEVLLRVARLLEAEDKNVRRRAAQVVGKILREVPDDGAFLREETLETLESKLLGRLSDKVPAVRASAAEALERLQIPERCVEGEDPVCNALAEAMQLDSSAEVRRAALKSTAITKETLQAMVERTRDLKEAVRACAYEQLAQRVHVKSLTISQRTALLENGLRDRHPTVRTACERMLCEHWISAVEGDPLALLELLDVEACEETAALALRTMFRCYTLKEYRSVTCLVNACEYNFNNGSEDNPESEEVSDKPEVPKALTPEGAIFWAEKAGYLAAREEDAALEELVQDLSSLCRIMQVVHERIIQQKHDPVATRELQFVLCQLLRVASHLDAQHDIVGQQNMISVAQRLLVSKDIESRAVLQACLYILRSFAGYAGEQETSFLRQGTEIILECLDPLDEVEQQQDEQQIDTEELDSLQTQLTLFVENEEYDKAADLKRQIEQLKNGGTGKKRQESCWREQRSLLLTECVLMAVRKPTSVPEFENILERVILPNLQQNESNERRQMAIRSLALYCQLDVALASRFSNILLMVLNAEEEDEASRIDAMKGIFDISMVWGFDALVDTSNTSDFSAAEEISFQLLEYLDSENEKIRLVAAEGFAKLSVVGRFVDVRILQCLLVLYFHPSSEHDERLRQCLAVCFPVMAKLTSAGRQAIERMSVSVLQAVTHPPEGSPLEELALEPLLLYVIYLLSYSEPRVQADFATSILLELQASPENANAKALIKALGALKPDEFPRLSLALLLKQTQAIASEIEASCDSVSRKRFSKWHQLLAATLEQLSKKTVKATDQPEQEVENVGIDQAWATLQNRLAERQAILSE